MGYPIKEFAEVQKEIDEVGMIVGVTEKYAGEILKNLKGIPYFYDKNLLPTLDYEYNKKRAEQYNEMVKIENHVLCSVGTYFFRKDVYYMICPGSIGDTLYVASLVKEYKKKNGISTVILIVRENQWSIPELFLSVDGCIASNEMADILALYCRSNLDWEGANWRYSFAREDLFHHFHAQAFEDINLLSGYKIALMGLEEESAIEEMYIEDEAVPEIFNKSAVIVMPHESNAKRLPFSLWEELCQELSKNYIVYTNIKDETELPIKGTQPVSESLKNMTAICEHCFAVISIRTGICDLLAFTKTNLIVLNTERVLAEHWNLKKVFHRDNLVNIDCYDDFGLDTLKENIMDALKCFSQTEERNGFGSTIL